MHGWQCHVCPAGLISATGAAASARRRARRRGRRAAMSVRARTRARCRTQSHLITPRRAAGVTMTLDQAVALSLLDNLSRLDLTARLHASDPELVERAAPLVGRARDLRERAATRGIGVLAWNDPRMPPALL